MASSPWRYGVLALAIAVSGAISPAALSQETNPPAVNPDEGFSSPDGEGGLLDSPTSTFDLIHQSVLRNDTTREEFQTRQRDRIGAEAANFLEQRQLRLQETQAEESDAIEAPIE